MEVGTRCLLDISALGIQCEHPSSSLMSPSSFPSNKVFGVLIGKRSHLEDPSRALFFFHTVSIEIPTEYRQLWGKGGFSGSTSSSSERMEKHFTNELISRGNYFVSSDGYKYQYDGWYDKECLVPISLLTEGEVPDAFQKEGGTSSKPMMTAPIPQSWVEAMKQQTCLCEVRYLCYAFLPWFHSPYERFSYLSVPERQCCYSLYICHRCLSPFFSLVHLAAHLEGYCEMARPPGEVIYLDPKTEQKVYYVDGARHLHYGRCASLLGKFFIESQLLVHDVDLYEFFIVTIPSRDLPYLGSEQRDFSQSEQMTNENHQTSEIQKSPSHSSFKEAAAHFDKTEKKWMGDVVVGYFSRLKHQRSHALSCIVVLPPFQRMGLGRFLLDLAYYLTRVRQSTCGCLQCGREGGAIARPFSPHGQQLLLHYWGAALRRVIQRISRHEWYAAATQDKIKMEGQQSRVGSSSLASGDSELSEHFITFKSLRQLQELMDIPIHVDDLEFLLVHDACAFYSTREQCSSRSAVGAGSTSSFAFPLVVTLAFKEKEIRSPSTPSAHFCSLCGDGLRRMKNSRITLNEKCFLRYLSGKLLYRKECFHY